MMIKLWTINRVLRYTGFRIVVEVSGINIECEEICTRIGIRFFGRSDL